MTKQGRLLLGWLSAIVLIVGFFVGFLPTSSGGVACGSAFIESDEAEVADIRDAIRADQLGTTLDTVGAKAAACEDRRSLLRVPAIALMVLGGGGFLLTKVLGTQQTQASS
jgi:hypothetical protein